jgi:hypothetical protein
LTGSKKQWDGVLNPGGIIGGLACGAAAGVLVFANVDPNNISRWAIKVPILALMGGAWAGTTVWDKLISGRDQTGNAIRAVHEQIVVRGADCPQCKLHHLDYRLIGSAKSLDEPCIVCRSCGRSSPASEFVDIPVDGDRMANFRE